MSITFREALFSKPLKEKKVVCFKWADNARSVVTTWLLCLAFCVKNDASSRTVK